MADYTEPCCCFDASLYTGTPDTSPVEHPLDVPAIIKGLDELNNSGREAEAEAYLVGEFVVHLGIASVGDAEGTVGGDGAGGDELLVDERIPDLGAVLLAAQDAVDGVGIAGTAAVEVGLFVGGDEEPCIDSEGETGEPGML